MASQNLCTLPNILNQNSCGSISTVQMGIKNIVKISLDNKNYKKLDTYYFDQIAAALASSTANLKLLFNVRFIFKQ